MSHWRFRKCSNNKPANGQPGLLDGWLLFLTDPTPPGCLATCSACTLRGREKKNMRLLYRGGAPLKNALFLPIPFSVATRVCTKCQAGFSGHRFPVKRSVNLNHRQAFSLFYRHDKWPTGARSLPPSECGKKQWLRTYNARSAHTEVWATRFFRRVALNESSTSCANGHKGEIMSVIYVLASVSHCIITSTSREQLPAVSPR